MRKKSINNRCKRLYLIYFLMLCFSFIFLFRNPVHAESIEQDKAMGDGWKQEELMTFQVVANPKAPSGAIAKGVDLSHYDGTVDFAKLKKAVDFVIIRCGYGQDMTSQDDAKFKEYVKGCMNYKIPFGVYLYSYAKNTTMAKGEANHTLRQLKVAKQLGASLSLPVFYDLEDSSVASSVSASVKAAVAKTYCSILENAGYKTGIYANTYWWNHYLTNSYFSGVTKWVAQFNDKFTYTGTAHIWQCSETAQISGISGKADLNYMLKNIYIKAQSTQNTSTKATTKITSAKVKISSLKNKSGRKLIVKWKKKSTVSGYQIRYSKYKSFRSSSYATVKKSSVTSKKLVKLKKKCTYYVKIRSYTVVSGKKYYSSWSASKHIKIIR